MPVCKQGYVNDELSNLCFQGCSSDQIVLSSNCSKKPPRYLDLVRRFNTEKECLDAVSNCQKLVDEKVYMEACQLHEKQLSFMCLSKCLDEFSEEELILINKDKRYCIPKAYYLNNNLFQF